MESKHDTPRAGLPMEKWELCMVYIVRPGGKAQEGLAKVLGRSVGAIAFLQRQIRLGTPVGKNRPTDLTQIKLDKIYKEFPRDRYMFNTTWGIAASLRKESKTWKPGMPIGIGASPAPEPQPAPRTAEEMLPVVLAAERWFEASTEDVSGSMLALAQAIRDYREGGRK